jgi:hypothetical protein
LLGNTITVEPGQCDIEQYDLREEFRSGEKSRLAIISRSYIVAEDSQIDRETSAASTKSSTTRIRSAR